MEKRLMLFLSGLFLCVGMAIAQTQVKGTIISADDGEPLPGASVKIQGEKMGTTTNLDGEFTITVPSADTRLQISHIGMLPRVVKARNGMRIALDTDNKLLDEVMVVTYGTQTKAQFTGSASIMNSEELEKYQVTNAVDALKGRASGVQITNTDRPRWFSLRRRHQPHQPERHRVHDRPEGRCIHRSVRCPRW